MEGEKANRAVPGDLECMYFPDESRRRFLKLAGLGGLCLAASPRTHAANAGPTPASIPPGPEVETRRHERYMRRAIAMAKQAPRFPFGAVIVQRATGVMVAEGHNRSAESPTFHGEIVVINRCAADHPSIDWTELDLYTTAEPCAMCQSAVEWAGIPTVYYGTSIPYLRQLGWQQIDIRAEEVARRTPFRQSRVIGGILAEECDALFEAAPRSKYRR